MKIWENQIDKTYPCWVESGSSRYEGRLVVMAGDQKILDEPVTISYGAPFGPDVADESDWISKAVAAVDKHVASLS